MSRPGQRLGWAGSAVLHLAAAGLALAAARSHPPAQEAAAVLVELPAPIPAAAADAVLWAAEPEGPREEAPAPAHATDAKPPDAMPPEAQQAAGTPPEPPRIAAKPPAPEPTPRETAETSDLPLPPPSMPPAPRPPRPAAAPPRPVVAQATTLAPAQVQAQALVQATPAPAQAVAAPPPPSYVARLVAALERQKRYPEEARGRQAQGVALLRFRMRRDGNVVAMRIERSAGDAALDDAVLAMIRRASPLPAAPTEMPGETLELTVPVHFAVR